MNQDKEQRILSLKKAIDSPSTPDHVKENMKIMIIELEAPIPPLINKKPKTKPKAKAKAKPKATPRPPICKLTDEQKDNLLYEFKKRRERKKNIVN